MKKYTLNDYLDASQYLWRLLLLRTVTIINLQQNPFQKIRQGLCRAPSLRGAQTSPSISSQPQHHITERRGNGSPCGVLRATETGIQD